MKAIDYIILLLVGLLIISVLRPTKKHLRGEGGCCGGNECIPEPDKELDSILGEVTLHVDGMTCENCENRIKRAINRLEGVRALVNRKKKEVRIQYNKEIDIEEIKRIIENLDYTIRQ